MCGYVYSGGAAILRLMLAPFILIRRASQMGFPLCAAAAALVAACDGRPLAEIYELPE